MTTAMVPQLTAKLASRLGMEGGEELVNVLKATAFKGQVSDAQMVALLVVANQYGLNPWTKEIYAFPDRQNGIVPVVGVDGWSRIINENAQFDGMEFKQDEESCTCVIYRKDRSHPVSVTEYMSECRRGAGPWLSHPKRMLRHKALIQCARLAFGYTGIYDQDEAERIAEVDVTPRNPGASVAEQVRPAIEDSEERRELYASLEGIAANQGIEAYSAAWQDLTKDERKMIGVEAHEKFKQMAVTEDEEEVDE